jgi:O-antigen ligase
MPTSVKADSPRPGEVNLLLGLDGIEPSFGVLVGGVLLALGLWLSWHRPSWLLLLALGSLAIRPQLLWGGPSWGYEWGLQHTLLVLALLVNGTRFGVRKTINWPIMALGAVLLLNLAFGNLHPRITLPFMLMSFAILALPFSFTQVNLAPGSRRLFGLVIAALPLVSVVLGAILQATDIAALFEGLQWGRPRLKGAAGQAAAFALIAFSGFTVALHESTRPGRAYAPYLAITNLAMVILSGTRMAILASAMFLAVYLFISAAFRELLRAHRLIFSLAGIALTATSIYYLPILLARMFHGDGLFAMSGREELWPFYLKEFWQSPVFGRGIGAGFIGGEELDSISAPHNEYLHLLVTGGFSGLILCLAGLALWYRWLLRQSSANDREFLLALIPALAIYAVTDNVILYWSVLPLYAYLGSLLTRPGLVVLEQPSRALPIAGGDRARRFL